MRPAGAGMSRPSVQPPPNGTPLFGPAMGFDASRAALRYGYASAREWLAADGANLTRRFALSAVPTSA